MKKLEVLPALRASSCAHLFTPLVSLEFHCGWLALRIVLLRNQGRNSDKQKENPTNNVSKPYFRVRRFSLRWKWICPFFLKSTTPFAIRPHLPNDMKCTTMETASYIIRGSSVVARLSRATFQYLRSVSNQWPFFNRVEVDFTWCEAASLARPQEPTTSIKCGTPWLLSVNSVLLSKNILRHEIARHDEHCALIVLRDTSVLCSKSTHV